MEASAVRYAQSGDVGIAYQVVGDGPLDVVFVPGFVSHLDLCWELFAFRRVWERIADFARLVIFDKRGSGLSERTERVPSHEERMDDIRAVMDAVGSERAAVVGPSGGGPMALLCAATYPERTTALVLWASYARRLAADDYECGVDPAGVEAMLEWIEATWGTGHVLPRVAFQDAPDDASTIELFARAERNAATPARAVAALRFGVETDHRDVLPTISAPTLGLHRSGDPLVPAACGRYLADHVPGARYVERPGDFHLSSTGRDDDFIDEIEEFLTGRRHVPTFNRVLKTVLFTDIVGSTERAAQVKDRRWIEQLDAHLTVVREELVRFDGVEVDTAGDGVLAVFDGPTRAIHCAQEIARRSRAIGIDVRAGLHTGECEIHEGGYAGLTLHIGARVSTLAGAGQVLVTSTVRDLVMGTDLEFDDRGTHTLKGVPGDWHVLAVRA